MNFDEAVRRRRMVRSFAREPVAPEALDRLLELAMRAPSAGFTQGLDLLVLEGAEQVRPFFEATCDPEFLLRPGAMAGLLDAPIVVLPLADPGAYTARYAEADKARSGLAGAPASEWGTSYWLVDASFAVLILLLAASDAGLGGLFFRIHRAPAEYLAGLGVPPGREVIGAVALGHESADRPGPAGSPARRPRRTTDDVVHRGHW